MSNRAEAGLTISAVAARTGLSVPVLRAGSSGNGFPSPAWLDGGHRRYDDDDVARILRVVEERRAGPLGRGRHRTRPAPPRAAWSRPRPRWHHPCRSPPAASRPRGPRPLPSGDARPLHAIEDECLALADQPTHHRSLPARRGLRAGRPPMARARTHRGHAVVFADFDRSRTRDGVHQIAIAPSTPLGREWLSCATRRPPWPHWPGGSAPTAGSRRCGAWSPTSFASPPIWAASSPASMRPGSGWRTRPADRSIRPPASAA